LILCLASWGRFPACTGSGFIPVVAKDDDLVACRRLSMKTRYFTG
jgi:hypothetical protein